MRKLPWYLSSQRRFIICSMIVWGVPMALFFEHICYSEHTLTVWVASYVFILSELGGCLWGLFMWHTFVKPRLGEALKRSSRLGPNAKQN